MSRPGVADATQRSVPSTPGLFTSARGAGALTELRRSTASRVFPLLLVGIWFLAVVQMPPDIVGQANNVALYVHVVGVIVIGITASAIAAWEVTRAGRTGVGELERSSSIGRSRLMLRVTGPVLVWAGMTYLAIHGAAQIRSVSVRVQFPSPTVILLTLAFIAALVAWGAFCGSLLPARVAPFIAAATAYLGGIVQALHSYDSAIARLFPVLQERWDPALKPDSGRLLLVTLWLLLFTVALHGLAARDRRMLRAFPAFTLLAALAVTATPLLTPPVVAGTFYSTTRDDSDPHTCQDVPRGGRVCLYAADAGSLPTFVAGYERARKAAGDLAAFPRTVADAGLSGPEPVMAYELFGLASVDQVTATILDYTAAPTSPDPQVCPSPPSFPLIGEDDLAHVIQVLLRERAGLPPVRSVGKDTQLLLEGLVRLDRSVQDAWLDQATRAYALCRAPEPPPEP